MKERINILLENKIIENYKKINYYNSVQIFHHFASKWYSRDIANMILRLIEIVDKGVEISNIRPPEDSLYFKENTTYYTPKNEILNKLTSGALATIIESYLFRCERPTAVNAIMMNYLKAVIYSKWRTLTEKHKLKLIQLASFEENYNASINRIISEKISHEPIHLRSIKEVKIFSESSRGFEGRNRKIGKVLKF